MKSKNFTSAFLSLVSMIFTVAFLILSSGDLSAQYTILYNDAANNSLQTEDVNTCMDIDSINTARIIIVSNGADNSTVTLTLPPGISYRAGSIGTLMQSGGLSIAESDISDLTAPVFRISPADLNSGDEITISWAREGSCDAVDYQMSGGTFKDIINVEGDAGNVLENNMNINTYDLLLTSLSILTHAPVTTSVNATENVELEITNGGQGCVEEFTFYIINEAGITTTNLQGVNSGTILTASSTNGDTTFYDVPTSFIMAEGLGNCFDNGEQIFLDREVLITSCESSSMYGVRWGCVDRTDCQIPFEAPGDFNIEVGVPNIRAVENIGNLDIFCTDGDDYAWTFTNIGTEPSPGTGAAYNVEVRVGWDWNAPWDPGANPQLPWTDFNIGGVTLIPTNSYHFALSDILPVGVDPDGPGGLEDLDNDGVFDDLAVDSSFVLDFYMDFTPACRSAEECISRRLNYRRPAWKTLFDDQCVAKEPTSDDASPSVYWLRRNVATEDGPTDMNDEDIATFCFYSGWISSGIVHHPTDTTELRLTLPDGLDLAPDPMASFSSASNPILEVSQVGRIATIKTKDGYNGTYKVDLILDCDKVTSNNLLIEWDLWHLPNDGTGSCCPERLECRSINVIAHCPLAPCPGIRTTSFNADRNTFGWTDEFMTTMITAETATELNIIYKEDRMLVDAPSVVNSDLDQVWVDIKYTNKAECNPFDFDSGVFEIYDASAGTLTSCPITAAPIIFDNGGGNYVQRIDATHLIGTCLPAGFIFAQGDSVNLLADLAFNGCGHDGSRYEFPSFRAEHKGVAPGGMDTLSCDNYGTRMEGMWPRPSFSSGTPTVERSGCESFGISLARNGVTSSHTEDFPNEYRPVVRIDTTYVDVPDFFRYVPNSLKYQNRVEGGNPTTIDLPDSKIVVSSNGNGTTRYTVINDGDLIPSDKNNNSACCVNENLYFTFQPTCQTPEGTTSMIARSINTDNLFAEESCWTRRTGSTTRNVVYTPPVLSLMPIAQNVQATTNDVKWEVQICNLTVTDQIDFNWLLIENSSGSVSIDGGSCQLFDDAGAPIGGPTTPVLNNASCGGSDFWYELGALGAGECKNVIIDAQLNSMCEADSITISHGWDCVSYPTDPCAIDCQIEDKLYVESLPSEVQLVVDSEPIIPLPLCTEQNVQVRVSSAQAAYLDNPILQIDLPPGTIITGDFSYEYPAGSNNIETAVFTQTGSLFTIQLEGHSLVGQDGLPGTIDALTPEDREITVEFSLNTDCDFTSGTGIIFQAFGQRPCGEKAINDGVRARTSDLSVLGADLPYSSAISIDMDGDSELVGCDGTDVEVNMEFVGLTQDMTTSDDSVFITLDAGVEFVDGSFACCSADPATCLTFAYSTVLPSGKTRVGLALPAAGLDITDPVMSCFSYQVNNSVDVGCDLLKAMTIESVGSITGVPCPTAPGGECPSLKIITGQNTEEFTTEKMELTVLNSEFNCTNISENIDISLEILIDSLDLLTGGSIYVDFYCANGAGQTTTYLDSKRVDGPVTAGSSFTVMHSVSGTPCNLDNGIIAVISQQSNGGDQNCVCEDLEIPSGPIECPECVDPNCFGVNVVEP